MGDMIFDGDLLRRYDRPGPRYTSYPTAPQFHAGFGEAELRTIEIGEKDIDTSSLPATKQVKLGGLTK